MVTDDLRTHLTYNHDADADCAIARELAARTDDQSLYRENAQAYTEWGEAGGTPPRSQKEES